MRLVTIDFLRGIAVLLVISRHIVFKPHALTIGWIGVDLFFVLSGFLVSNLLFKEYNTTGSIKPIRFLVRRGLKIYPLFYIMIFSLFFILAHEQPHLIEDLKKGLLNEILFIQNYNTEQVLIGHTWSLAVEEHFYLALTLLVFILARLKILSNKVLFNGLTLLVLVSCLIMRNNVALLNPKTPFFLYLYPTHLRFDTLWIGVYIAHQYNYNQQAFKAFFANLYWLPFCLLAFLVPLFFPLDNRFLITIGLTIIALCFGITLAALISNDKSEDLLTKIFGKRIVHLCARIGTYSYAIYLFHMTIIVVVKPFSPDLWTRISSTLLVIILIVLIGVLATELIEKPILKWRDKYIK